jgi:hypothetical protein
MLQEGEQSSERASLLERELEAHEFGNDIVAGIDLGLVAVEIEEILFFDPGIGAKSPTYISPKGDNNAMNRSTRDMVRHFAKSLTGAVT